MIPSYSVFYLREKVQLSIMNQLILELKFYNERRVLLSLATCTGNTVVSFVLRRRVIRGPAGTTVILHLMSHHEKVLRDGTETHWLFFYHLKFRDR